MDKYEFYALLIITFAVCLRVVFTILGWPMTNADEGTMGIMARHIAYNGEHPVLYYGQNYMGALEAYLGAVFFRLFGASIFTLRLGIILLDTFFFISMYLLTRLLYTKQLALFVLILLSLGSNAVFLWELYAKGGSTQTLLFGALAFLLAAWLSLTYSQDLLRSRRWLRYAGYGSWGLVVGLGIWSDMIVLPFFMMSSLLLLLFCWRDLRSWAPLCLLLGVVIGIFPLLAYNFQAPPGQDSLSTFLALFHGPHTQSAHTLPQLIRGIKETVRMSLPTATGDPFCPVSAINYALDASPRSLSCTILHSGWSVGYMSLWTLAIFFSVRALWKLRACMKVGSFEERQEIILHFARLCLLVSAVVALASYILSSGPQSLPHSHARYLIGLLIVTPALIWPLWSAADALKSPLVNEATRRRFTFLEVKTILNRGILLLIVVLFLIETVSIGSDIPSSQTATQQQDRLIADLMRIGATRIYTDYWTCYSLVFVSQEKIICSVTDRTLLPSHNRYSPYYIVVKTDPHAAYVFNYDIFRDVATMRKADPSGHGFRRFVFDGYIIYQPE
ncbi:MAG: hypothetical protein NVSMB33_11450 [Ktedonobacteraceae bacterium]